MKLQANKVGSIQGLQLYWSWWKPNFIRSINLPDEISCCSEFGLNLSLSFSLFFVFGINLFQMEIRRLKFRLIFNTKLRYLQWFYWWISERIPTTPYEIIERTNLHGKCRNLEYFVGKRISHTIMMSDNEHKIKTKFQIIIADHPNKETEFWRKEN